MSLQKQISYLRDVSGNTSLWSNTPPKMGRTGSGNLRDKVMQSGSQINSSWLYINNHRYLKETFGYFTETVSNKFLLQFNVAVRKGNSSKLSAFYLYKN